MKNKLTSVLSLSALIVGAALSFSTQSDVAKTSAVTNYVVSTSGCSYKSSLPTTVYLDPVEEEDIRQYYSSLNSLSASERKGTNLLKNLKPILYEMNYFAYGGWSSGGVTAIYSITDRDWTNSPVTSITAGTYNSSDNTITGFNHVNEIKSLPNIHMLYVDYSIETTTPAKKNASDSSPYFDKEHVWCQSRGFKSKTSNSAEGPAGTDIHHLIAGDSYVNQKPHNNNPYGFVDVAEEAGDRDSTINNKKGTALHASSLDESSVVFEPQDSDKGDIARAIFYMAARYNNYSGTDTITDYEPNLVVENFATSAGNSVYSTADSPVGMGILRDLLAWNKIDPVDEYEIHRNDLIYRNYQGNRNPFIDFPEWIDYIWGTTDLEGNNYNSTPTGSADPRNDILYYTGSTNTPVTGVSLDKSTHSMDRFITPTVELTATVEPNEATNKAVTWTSSDTSVATVSDGTVTALKAGTVTITATTVDGGFTDSCTITITDTTPIVSSVTLNQNSATIDVTRVNQVQLTATVNGENYPPSKVNWTSSNTSIATVNSSGLVSAVSPGIVTITATSDYDNTKSATCTVTVIDSTLLTDTLTKETTGVSGNYSHWENLKVSTDAVYKGYTGGSNESIQMRSNANSDGDRSGIISTTSGGNIDSVSLTWNDATVSGRTVNVYGSNTAYTSVNDLYDSTKRGTLLGTIVYGTSTSLEVSGDYAYVGVTSSSGALYLTNLTFNWVETAEYIAVTGVSLDKETASLIVDDSTTLVATITPDDASHKSITWSSSDESVATVSDAGLVTAVSAGTAVITVDTNDGHFQDSCTITVLDNPKIKHGNYAEGVSYKMYLQTKGYFNGDVGSREYFGDTTTSYSDGVDVYFETLESKLMLYYMNGDAKTYIVAYKNGSYDNFGRFTADQLSSQTIYDWRVDSDGHLIADCNGTDKTFGLKSGQDFTTFALNEASLTVKFIDFEYTAESFAKDFIDKITCDSSGNTAPGYASGFGWSDFKLIYNNIDSTQRTILTETAKSETGTTIQKMLAKYEYMVWKYHYEDFLSRNVVLSSNINSFGTSSNDNSIGLIIILIATVSLAGTSVVIYRKKKEH